MEPNVAIVNAMTAVLTIAVYETGAGAMVMLVSISQAQEEKHC
jgi:hypothetical protein